MEAKIAADRANDPWVRAALAEAKRRASMTDTEAAAERTREDADLARAQAAATARAAVIDAPSPDPVKPVGQKLPLAARIAMAGPERMFNVPIHEPDLDNFQGRPFDRKTWLARVETALGVYDFGHVHHATVVLACRELADAAEGGRGMVRWTYVQWADFGRCCRSTIHKIIRALWDAGLVRIVNAFYWKGREQRRAANAYFPVMADDAAAVVDGAAVPEAVPEAAPPVGAVKALARIAAALRDLVPHLPGLHARALGLNTSPLREDSLRAEQRQREGRPAPA